MTDIRNLIRDADTKSQKFFVCWIFGVVIFVRVWFMMKLNGADDLVMKMLFFAEKR